MKSLPSWNLYDAFFQRSLSSQNIRLQIYSQLKEMVTIVELCFILPVVDFFLTL